MSLSIGRIITVNISRQASTVARAGFGVGLIMGSGANAVYGATEYVREYTGASDMLGAGFLNTDPEYLAALAYFSQSQKPAKVLIGKYTPVATVKTLTYAGVLTGGTVSVVVNGTLYFQAFTTNQDDTMTALAALIQADSRVATCTWNNASALLTITSTAGNDVSVGAIGLGDFTGATLALGTQPSSTFAAALAAIRDDNDSWFMLYLADYGFADALAAMATIEALSRMHCLTVFDYQATVASDATNLAYVCQANNYANSFAIYSDVYQPLGAAWMGLCLPFDPGAETWKFKTLAGVVASGLTETQASNLDDIRCNWYAAIGGVDITSEGVVGSGEFIDILRLVYWTQARIREGVYTQLTQLPKMPYTDVGFSLVESVIWQVLRQGVAQGGYIDDEKLSVTVPKRADISQADAALRALPNVEFYATLAGAVHSVAVQGVVSV